MQAFLSEGFEQMNSLFYLRVVRGCCSEFLIHIEDFRRSLRHKLSSVKN